MLNDEIKLSKIESHNFMKQKKISIINIISFIWFISFASDGGITV